ncbi:MAG: uncharacterized protein JWL64_46 [Frankiales bacterium]|nr:uncharacterized protein [Frankiales bacterium]
MAGPRVAVVTDSTAYLDDDLVLRRGITVVPLHVVLGRRTGTEHAISPTEVALALGERRLAVTTSRPSPAELAAAYRATGATRIVSVHLSSALSGTVDAAVLAARDVAEDGITVSVVDSRTIAMGVGFAVLAAAESAARGRELPAVAEAAREAATRTEVLLCVDTLEHLRKGGRIGAASALLGTALAVKPVLQVRDGELILRERVRTSARAMSRMVDVVAEAAGQGPVDVAVHHLAVPERAERLAQALRERVPDLGALHVRELGAVVGAHVGPGGWGIVVHRR